MGKFLPENATNLGKMNHSHFIWTSVLTPLAPSLLHPAFIHLWQFYYKLCRWLEAQEPKRMLHGDGPKCWGVVEYIMVSPPCSMTVIIPRTLWTNILSIPEKTHWRRQDKILSIYNLPPTLLQSIQQRYLTLRCEKTKDLRIWPYVSLNKLHAKYRKLHIQSKYPQCSLDTQHIVLSPFRHSKNFQISTSCSYFEIC